jgi:cold shock protein
MAHGHVKVFHPDKNYGFVTTHDGEELYVSGEQVNGDALRSGDEVEFDIESGERGRPMATGVKVTKPAPADNPIGRTMSAPPTWEELEERERQRRMARRRRR